MTLDPTNPEHRLALRWACVNLLGGWRTNTLAEAAVSDPQRAAVRALCCPTESAALVRDLIQPFDVGTVWHCSVLQPGFPLRWSLDPRGEDEPLDIDAGMVPDILLRLLDATTREEALAALKEFGQ